MSRQMAARHILGSNGPRGQSQKFVAHHRLIWQTSVVCFYIYWALIIHICEELCICALPGSLEPSHPSDVVILWFMSWYRRVQPKGFGVVCFFLFLLCFTTASLKSDSVENFSVLCTGNVWPMKTQVFSYRRWLWKSQTPRGPSDSISSCFWWDGGGEKQEAEASWTVDGPL